MRQFSPLQQLEILLFYHAENARGDPIASIRLTITCLKRHTESSPSLLLNQISRLKLPGHETKKCGGKEKENLRQIPFWSCVDHSALKLGVRGKTQKTVTISCP